MKRLDDYRESVGEEVVGEIRTRAGKLRGTKIVHVNSTSEGGGVAEILNSLVPLMNDVGIETEWKVIGGNEDFFALTKEFHNALQGGPIHIGESKEQLYLCTNEDFSGQCTIDADCVVVHDPQPLPLISFYEKAQPWIWRCHVDLSDPDAGLWEFLKTYICMYDMAIVSNAGYRKADLPVEQRIVYPAIDPLSPKNRWLSPEEVQRYISAAGIPTDKPLITQVSRMDLWKDPEGLLDIFERVRRKADCRLVYCYSSSVDDPEGEEVLSRTRDKAQDLVDSGDILFVEGTDQVLVNALQRCSTVVMQNSIKEGFCLCVTEALWKGKPVVGTNVGGIPVQLREAENGFLVEPNDPEAFADKVVQILENPKMAEYMGARGKEIVRREFLITRFMLDCMDLYDDLLDQAN
jgi:trehalose synthase